MARLEHPTAQACAAGTPLERVADTEDPAAGPLQRSGRERLREIDAQQRERRRQPQAQTHRAHQISQSHIAGALEDVARIHEADAAQPPIDGDAHFLVEDEERLAPYRIAEEVA